MKNWFTQFFARRQQQRRIEGMFGSCVSPDAVKTALQSGGDVAAVEREITSFFASVHAYVSIAEQLPSSRLVELINAYFEACTAEIQQEHGTLDKYIGDAVVAMFGAPVRVEHHALHACLAALRCQAKIAALREHLSRDANPWPELARHLRVRIGLNSGMATIGNLGTKARINYTAMGDSVNIAARLETIAKSYGVWTLCSDATQRACEQAERGRVVFRALPPVRIKGRTGLTDIFEIVGVRESVSDRQRECIACFESGLACWKQGDWAGAIQYGERSATLEWEQPATMPGVTLNPSLHLLALARATKEGREPGPVGS